MKIPKDLALWHHVLGLFSEDVASLLRAIAKEISPLVEDLSYQEFVGSTEPDGYSGISNKVNYERLLLTEWGMQDQHPEEFMRRAASGEHLFLDLHRVEPKSKRQSIALFDCGPQQLGRPRLVQLVLIILLARRAAKSGCDFRWGVFQDNSLLIQEAVSKQSIEYWLSQRSAYEVQNNHAERWIDRINEDSQEQGVDLVDLWVVSNNAGLPAELIARRVSIEERLIDGEKIYVDVEYNGKKRSKSLSLNNENVNVKTLRDPFHAEERKVYLQRDDHNGRWLVGATGLRFGCLNSAGDLALYNLNKHKETKPQAFQIVPLHSDRRLAGVYLSKKLMLLLSSDERCLYIDNLLEKAKSFNVQRPSGMSLSNATFVPMAVGRQSENITVFILDDRGTVYSICLGNRDPELTVYRRGVLAMGQSTSCTWMFYDENVQYENLENPLYRLEWYSGSAPVRDVVDISGVCADHKIYSHGSGTWNKRSVGAFAIPIRENTWRVMSNMLLRGDVYQVSHREDQTVIGVLNVNNRSVSGQKIDVSRYKAKLVVLNSDRRTISLLCDEEETELMSLEADFCAGELNPQLPILHYLDSHQTLRAQNLISGRVLFELDQGVSV